jgi:putative peptide zinc metalloprotease protein
VRIAVSAWVLIVVPALLFELLILLVHLPRLVATAWSSGVSQYHHAQRGFSSGDPIAGLTAAVQLVVLAIPVVGIGLMLVRTGRGGITAVWSRTAGRPVARSFAVAVMVACAALLVRAWVPAHNYKPIQRHERGTVLQGVAAIRHLPAGRQSLYVYDQSVQRGGPSTMTDAPSTTELPPATTTTVARTTETSLTRGGTTGTTAANLFDTETTVRRQSTTPTTTSDMSPSAGGDTTATTTP